MSKYRSNKEKGRIYKSFFIYRFILIKVCLFVQIKLEYSLSLEGADKTLSLLDLALHGSELKKLDAVTSKSVSAAASAALSSIPSYVVLGKTHETPSFNEILKLLK